MTRFRIAATTLVAIALVLSGCGADGRSGDEFLTQPTLPAEVSDRVLSSASSTSDDAEPAIAETRIVTFAEDTVSCPLGDSGLAGKTGYEVKVEAGSRLISYLVTDGGDVLMCEESGVTPVELDIDDAAAIGPTTTASPSGAGIGAEPPEEAVSPRDLTQAMVDAIKADAAERAAVSVEQVSVNSTDQQTFNDSSLDCPEPGWVYSQVLTPGYRVVVDAAGQTYDYRVNSLAGSFKLCE